MVAVGWVLAGKLVVEETPLEISLISAPERRNARLGPAMSWAGHGMAITPNHAHDEPPLFLRSARLGCPSSGRASDGSSFMPSPPARGRR